MKKKRILLITFLLAISILIGYWLTQTERYRNYRQMQFLDSVVQHMMNKEKLKIKLEGEYTLLGYQMKLTGEGFLNRDSESLLYLSYLMNLNGEGVSPLTVELNQYIQSNQVQYMSLNNGQWFKEEVKIEEESLNYMLKAFKDTNILYKGNDYELLEENREIQIVRVKIPFLKSDFLFQQLIKNIFEISDEIDFNKLFESSRFVDYVIKINKETKNIVEYDISYTDGIHKLIYELRRGYPDLFSNITDDQISSMYITMSIKLSNTEERYELPNGVKLDAVDVKVLK